MIEIIGAVMAVTAVLLMIIIIYRNKFQLTIIKINEAENNIDVLFERKLELLDRTIPIIKKEIKDEDFFAELETIDIASMNHFEVNDLLKKKYNELFKVIDDNEKLLKSKALVSVIDSLNANEEEIVGLIKFYNDSVVSFNQLITIFPSNILAFVFRYKKKEFYNNEKREIYEILNKK